MGETEQNRILSRVKKMLNLANDAGATEGERDNALRMAYATLAKYNLDIAQVDDAAMLNGGKATDEKRELVNAVYYGVCWTRSVSMAIAQLFFCEYFYAIPAGKSDFRIRHSFVGRTANAVTASEMAAYIVASIDREAKTHARGAYSPGRAQRDFAKGAVEKIIRRCYELRTAAEKAPSEPTAKGGPGTALVLASFYKKELEANKGYLVKTGITTVTQRGRERSANDYEAYSKGREFGSKINLDRQVR
jgi:uncharacterized protein DUF2786